MTDTVAQGIAKKLSFVKQTGIGVAGSTGGQVMRRVTSTFSATRDTFKGTEIVTHEQSTGIGYGLKKTTGKISGLLSPLTYSKMFAAALRADFAAVPPYEASTIAAVADTGFTDSASGFLTAGFKVGDVVQATGFTATANNNKNFFITALTAGTMTGVYLDASSITAESAANDITITVIGQKSKAPLTGHTNDYFSFEDWYSDISKSELFTDVKVNQIDVALPATGNSTISIDLLGLGRTLGAAQVLASPTAETTTPLLTAVNGVIYSGGVAQANITGLSLTITGNMAAGDAVVGSNSSVDIARGLIEVSGSFTALFTDSVISALYDAETPTSLVAVLADNVSDKNSPFIGFTLGRIKLTGDAPDDGQKMIVRTYPFTAEINTAGGAALAWDETILSIQDSEVS